MTGSLDTTLRDAAFDICNDVGKTYTIVEQSTESYNPATGTVGGLTTTTTMSILGSPPLNFNERLIDEKFIRQGDVQVIVPFKQSSTLTLASSAYNGLKRDAPGQRWKFDGHDWTVVSLSPVYSGENVAAYEFQLRK